MRKLVYSIAILVLLFSAACNSSEKPAEAKIDSLSTQTARVGYTCPMHPEITSDKPGTCSICKMDLVKDSTLHSDDMMTDSSSHDAHQH